MPSGDEARRGCRRQAGLHCRHVLCPLVSGDLRRDVGPPCRAALVVRKGGGQRSFAGLLGQRRSSSTATRTRLPSRMRRRSCWTCRSKLSSEIPRAAAALLRVRVTRDGAGHETAPGGARRACGGPGGPRRYSRSRCRRSRRCYEQRGGERGERGREARCGAGCAGRGSRESARQGVHRFAVKVAGIASVRRVSPGAGRRRWVR
jgi:hypothetical protein